MPLYSVPEYQRRTHSNTSNGRRVEGKYGTEPRSECVCVWLCVVERDFNGVCVSVLYVQRLWFPTGDEGRGSAFSFSLSSAAEIGGPQGSFECVQQCGSRSLESHGLMALKMSIKAKDDVYEATRQRMAVAEEESKKNW